MQTSFARVVLGALSLAVMAAAIAAQSRPPEGSGDWPMYSHSLSGQRYSPLTDINAANVAR